MYAGEVADREVRQAQKAKQTARRKAKRCRKETGLPPIALSASGRDTAANRLAHSVGVHRRANIVLSAVEGDSAPGNLSRTVSDTSFSRLAVSGGMETDRTPHESNEMVEHGVVQARVRNELRSDSSTSELASSTWKTVLLWPKFINLVFRNIQRAHNRATRSKALTLPISTDPSPFTIFSRTACNAVSTAENDSTVLIPMDDFNMTNAKARFGKVSQGKDKSAMQGPDPAIEQGYAKGRFRRGRLKAMDTF